MHLEEKIFLNEAELEKVREKIDEEEVRHNELREFENNKHSEEMEALKSTKLQLKNQIKKHLANMK